jgi:hypothetical protein
MVSKFRSQWTFGIKMREKKLRGAEFEEGAAFIMVVGYFAIDMYLSDLMRY